MNDADLHSLIDRLAERGLSVATAESLTGGALCARLVDVPGASRVVLGGVCTYATRLKAEILGVNAEHLARMGPVDEEVSIEMARGVRELTGASIGLATTGVAGPGPQDGHAAGTVHIACVDPWGQAHRLLHLSGGRSLVRRTTVDEVLSLLVSRLDSGEGASSD